jgi:hypothetical protein
MVLSELPPPVAITPLALGFQANARTAALCSLIIQLGY